MRALVAAVLCSAMFAGTLYLGGQSVDAFEGPPASSGVVKATDGPNRRAIRLNARDRRLARVAVLTKADLGRFARLEGGAKKVDFSDELACVDYRPKVSDLVTKGAAETRYTGPGISVSSRAEVLQTPRMVQLEWKRTLEHRNFLSCARRTFAQGLARNGGRLLSFRRVPFPRLAPYAARYRMISRVKNRAGRRVTRLTDLIALGKGRHELALIVAVPLRSRAAADRAEVRLAKLLLARVRGATPPRRPVRSEPAYQLARGLTVYEVPGEPFRIGIPPAWTARTAREAYGPRFRAAMRRSPQPRRFRKSFPEPDWLFRLVAAKAECGRGCTSLGVMAIPRRPGWRPAAFEAGVLARARRVAVAGARPTAKRIRLPAGRALRIRNRANTPFGVLAMTQYVVHTRTSAYILSYGTPPRFARRYSALFERSARSLREP